MRHEQHWFVLLTPVRLPEGDAVQGTVTGVQGQEPHHSPTDTCTCPGSQGSYTRLTSQGTSCTPAVGRAVGAVVSCTKGY